MQKTAAEQLGEMAAIEGDTTPKGDEAPVAQEETTTEAAAELTTESTDGESTGEPEGEHKVPAEVQASIDRRIGKEIEKARKERERAEALEAKVADLSAKADEGWLKAAEALAVHPAYLSKPDAELVTRANALEAEELRLADNPDGIESDDPDKAMSPQQVRRRLVEVRQELTRMAPKADAAYAAAKQRQLADLELGRKVRMDREAAAAKAKAAAAAGGGTTTAPRGAAATSRPVSDGGTRRPSQDVEAFKKAGRTAEAAAKELAKLVPEIE